MCNQIDYASVKTLSIVYQCGGVLSVREVLEFLFCFFVLTGVSLACGGSESSLRRLYPLGFAGSSERYTLRRTARLPLCYNNSKRHGPTGRGANENRPAIETSCAATSR